MLRPFTPHEHIITLLQLLRKLALFANHVALTLVRNHKSCHNIQRVLVNRFRLPLIIILNVGCVPFHEVINEVDGTRDLVNATGKQD